MHPDPEDPRHSHYRLPDPIWLVRRREEWARQNENRQRHVVIVVIAIAGLMIGCLIGILAVVR